MQPWGTCRDTYLLSLSLQQLLSRARHGPTPAAASLSEVWYHLKSSGDFSFHSILSLCWHQYKNNMLTVPRVKQQHLLILPLERQEHPQLTSAQPGGCSLLFRREGDRAGDPYPRGSLGEVWSLFCKQTGGISPVSWLRSGGAVTSFQLSGLSWSEALCMCNRPEQQRARGTRAEQSSLCLAAAVQPGSFLFSLRDGQ